MAAYALHPKFRLGRIAATKAAVEAMTRSGDDPIGFLIRHQSADWGQVCPQDKAANDTAIAYEGDKQRQQRVLSSYSLKNGRIIWIITEADRSSTTILSPSDY